MEFKIAPTSTTPSVYFNTESKILLIEGKSISENPSEVVEPIFVWIEDFFSNPENSDLMIIIKLEFYNSSSFKSLLKLLNYIEKYHKQNKDIKIMWYIHKDDETEIEDVQEITSQINLKIETQYF